MDNTLPTGTEERDPSCVDDATIFESSIASFLASCESTLRDARREKEVTNAGQAKLIPALVVVTATVLAALSFERFAGGSSIAQAALISCGVSFGVYNCVSKWLNKSRSRSPLVFEGEVENELDRYRELTSALSRLSRLRREWSSKLRQSQDQLASTIDQVATEASELISIVAKKSSAEQAITDIEQKIASSHADLVGLTSEIEQKVIQRDAVDADLLGLTTSIATAKEQLAAVSDSVESMQRKLTRLKDEKSATEQLVASLEAERLEAAAAVNALKLEENALRESVVESEAKLRDCKSELATQQSYNAERKEESATLLKQVEDLRSTIAELSTSYEQLQNEKSVVEAEVAVAQSELDQLAPVRRELIKVQQETEQQLYKLQEQQDAIKLGALEIDKVKVELAALKTQLVSLRTEQTASEAQLESTLRAMEEKTTQLEEVGSKFHTLQSEADRIETRRSELIAENANILNAIATCREESVNTELRLSELKKEVDCLTETHDVLVSENANYTDERTRLVDSIESLKQESQRIQQEQIAMRDAVEAAVANLELLTNRTNEVQSELSQATTDCKETAERIDLMKCELESATHEVSRLQLKAVALRSQESQLRTEIANLELQRSESEERISLAKESLAELNEDADRMRESIKARDAIRLQLLKCKEERDLLLERISASQCELKSIQDQVDATNEILHDQPRRVAELDDDIRIKSEALARLEADLDTKQSALLGIEEQILQVSQTHESLSQDCDLLRDQAAELEQVIALSTARNQQLESDHNEYLQIVELRETAAHQLLTLRKEIEEAEFKMKEITDSIASDSALMESGQAEIQRLQAIRAGLGDEIDDCQSAVSQAENQRQAIIVESDRLTIHAENLKASIHELEIEVDRLENLRSQGDSLRQENDRLIDELETKRIQLTEVELKINEMTNSKTAIGHEIESLEDDCQSKQRDLQQLIKEAEIYGKTLSSAESQRRVLEDDLLHLQGIKAERESIIRELESSIKSAQERENVAIVELDRLRTEVAKWQDAAIEAEQGQADLELLQQEKQTLLNDVDQARGCLAQAEQGLNELVGIRANAENDLQAILIDIETHRKSLADLQDSAGGLVGDVKRLEEDKRSLERELVQMEGLLNEKQREIASIEAKDLQRQSMAIRELESSALQVAETERRLAAAKESLRAQEENVNEALAVSKQWDSYIASLRSKCEELQQLSLKSNQGLQETLAEKLRAEEELQATRSQIGDASARVEGAKVELDRLSTAIASSVAQQSLLETSLRELNARSQHVDEMLNQQTSQLEQRTEQARRIELEIAAKNQYLSELAVAEGRLIERQKTLEASIQNAAEVLLRLQERNESERLANAERESKAATPVVAEESLLNEIESLVETLERTAVEFPGTDHSPDATAGDGLSRDQGKVKQPAGRQVTPPDSWASVFG